MTAPTISIIVPAYNRENYVADALKSIQMQPDIQADIIVVDDGSTDDTVNVVRSIGAADPRVRLIKTSHSGVAKARNIGLCAACSEYVTFLDSDDLFAPNRLRRQIDKLRARSDVTVVAGHNQWFVGITPDFKPILVSTTYRRTDPHVGSAVFRRSLFDEYGMFDESMEMGEDLDFYLRLFEADARILVEVETVLYYRVHDQNMTNDQSAMYRGVLQAYHKSIQRREKAGRTERLEIFFHRPFDKEVVVGGR